MPSRFDIILLVSANRRCWSKSQSVHKPFIDAVRCTDFVFGKSNIQVFDIHPSAHLAQAATFQSHKRLGHQIHRTGWQQWTLFVWNGQRRPSPSHASRSRCSLRLRKACRSRCPCTTKSFAFGQAWQSSVEREVAWAEFLEFRSMFSASQLGRMFLRSAVDLRIKWATPPSGHKV